MAPITGDPTGAASPFRGSTRTDTQERERTMQVKKIVLSALIGAAALVSGASHAASVSFDFGATAGTETNSGNYGNVRTYTSGGLTATVTGWSLTGSRLTSIFPLAFVGTFETARTGYHGVGYGLGICNQDEGRNCGSPSHTADNSGADDFFLIRFSQAVDPTSVRIRPFESDSDFSYATGNLTAAQANLNGDTLAEVLALLGDTLTDYNDTATSSNAFNASLDSGFVNTLLIGARSGQSDDFFKLLGVTAETTPPAQVPVPGTVALMGVAAFGLGLARRRRG